MNLKQCIEAFDALLNQNLSFDGNEVIFSFENHEIAVSTIFRARDILATMKAMGNAQ